MFDYIKGLLGGAPKQQQPERPRGLLALQTEPPKAPPVTQTLSGSNRKRWTDYAEAEASAGREALPYAEWLKRQQR